jgi:hypothetical protein
VAVTAKQIVEAYIRDYRPFTRHEMNTFKREASASTAISRAALCRMEDGKRHPHQRRIPKIVLEQTEARLQAIRRKLAQAPDFAALHSLVKSEIKSIRGVGALMVYDIAHRIGAYFGKAPERVYLHAGTRVGARVLGITGDSFDPKVLPKEFACLAPSEIEDCLCIYKAQLKGGAQKNSSSPDCVIPKRSRC